MSDGAATEAPASGRIPPPWLGLVLITALVAGGVAVVIAVIDSDPPPPFVGEAAAIAGSPRLARDRNDGVVRLAGDGTSLPLTSALLAAYEPSRAGRRPLLHASIGSDGGVLALLDGAIDVALVSRPLLPSEREQGLVAIPYARIAVVVGVHPTVPLQTIDRALILDLYAGRITRWSDDSAVVAILREPGNPSQSALAALISELAATFDGAYRERRFRVVYHESEMHEALASVPGSIGVVSGARRSSDHELVPLRFEGVAPDADGLRAGTYPLYQDLMFVTRGQPEGEIERFVRFVHGEHGRRIVEDMNGVALTATGGLQ